MATPLEKTYDFSMMKESKGGIAGAICGGFYLMGIGDSATEQKQAWVLMVFIIIGILIGHFVLNDDENL